MKVLRACVLTAVVATTLSLGASVALLGEDSTVRETRDRHEIEALMWKYTRALDKGDGATYASTYTLDGQFGAGANVTRSTPGGTTDIRDGSAPYQRIKSRASPSVEATKRSASATTCCSPAIREKGSGVSSSASAAFLTRPSVCALWTRGTLHRSRASQPTWPLSQ